MTTTRPARPEVPTAMGWDGGGRQPGRPAQQATTASVAATVTPGSPLPATSDPSAASPVASALPSQSPSPRATQAVPATRPPVPVQTLMLGRSVQGRPITAVE